MMLKTLFSAVALSLLAPSSLFAGELRTSPNAVLELFTSQGCSSCPPADAILSELGERDDIIALAYHVDYWDYIGWKDTFGRPEHADLQRDYARAWASSRIYTPQLVVNGAKDVVGSRRADVSNALENAQLSVPVNLNYHDDMLEIDVAGNASWPESKLWIVTFKKNEPVTIERGENQDREIDYSHIVTGRQVLGMWEPDTGASLKLPLREILGDTSDGAAVIVQTDIDGLPGQVIGAASFSL